MAIDVLKPRRIRIQEVVIPEPTTRPHIFDAERIITPDLWEKHKKELRELTTQYDRTSGISLAANISAQLLMVFPDRREELGITENFDLFFRHRDGVSDHSLKLLYPQEAADEFLKKNTLSFDTYKNYVVANYGGSHGDIWPTFVLFPDRMQEIVKIPGLEVGIASNMDNSRKQGKWLGFLTNASNFKLLHPRAKINLSSQEWMEIERQLDKDCKFPLHPLYAGKAKIVASDNIEMTARGLVVSMPNPIDLLNPKQPVPEYKRF